MADKKSLYSTCVAILGFVCFVVGATAIGVPMWGYFDTPNGGPSAEKGYFGPWRTCKQLLYHRERCGKDASRFRVSVVVWIAGLVAAAGVAILGVFCVLSVLQLAMLSSKEKVVMRYSIVLTTKLALGLLAGLLAIAAAGLFALQTDDKANSGFQITRGPAFYIQVLLIILNAVLFVMSLYDLIFSRRDGGDPTKSVSIPVEATTYGNPGYRDRGPTNGAGVSMTDASGKPYLTNGSTMSMNTTMTSASSVGSNGSTVGSSVTRSPLRSSLKKPKPKDGFGIQNPGFSGSSPTFSRNGSVKKVRIQTHSTEV
ncbi:hypothetical protein PPYR_12499 [Photinus pyralis]|uniref:Uncharacterized protein n=1 Tax=Photinus pyralis TaxID=7054 RepID=A0A1Y1LP15_PHOPY|nr:uncharacterized protein LOC116177979 [Photinus pyralis]KAB0792879.1 hypothetical protein PPYR_12499 [Photinus pyralis]